MEILEAFKKVTESVRDWTNEKLNNKVDKISNKGLSTNDYTTADKNRVTNIPSDLTIIDGKLYLSQDGNLISSGVTLPSGGGGGGSSSAAITLTNKLESNTITVAVGGAANLIFSYASSEDTGNGTVYIYIGGNLKGTSTVIQGENTLDIGQYIGEGTNEVRITCLDMYSNSKSLSYTVNAIALKITSTFDDSQIYSGDINVRYIPYGAIEKTIHFVVDGIDTTIIVSETGKQQTQVLPAMYHGTHLLRVYVTANVNGVEIKSNELIFDVLCIEEGATTPMIASAYSIASVTQGELISIPFAVYDPSNMTTEVTLTIKKDDEIYSTATRTVDRTRQIWNTRDYPVGNVTFTITYGNINKSHTVVVAENSINVAVKKTDLEFQLRAAGKSNEDNDRDIWTSGDITTTFEYFNWDSTGWVEDENGDAALRLSGDAKATINFMPFKTDARQTGRTIEMEFAIRDVNNRDAVAISCLSGGIGFTVTADTAKLMSEQSEIMCNYTDEEKIRVAFVIEPKSEYRLVSVYLNGVLSGAKQYLENDNWQQTDPVNITVGSPYCCVDLYCIRAYDTALTTTEVRDNYIADVTNVQEKSALYTDNNIYDAFGGLSFSALKDKIPILVITGSLPTYKGDKRNVVVTYTDPLNPSLDFEDTAKIDVQGTSSAGYVRKNWKIKTSEPHILDLNQVETKVLCWKVDYAEATGTHNTGNANYVHMFYGDVKTPPQEDDDRVRTTIYGRPCVIFHKADSGSEPVFYGKSNSNVDKGGEEVFGFTHSEYSSIAQSVEFCNNDILACKFHAPIPDVWESAFEFRYPDGHKDISDFKIMHDWVVSTWQEGASGNVLNETYIGTDGTQYTNDTAEYRLAKFKKEFTEHFDFDFCLIYYLYTFVILMVDQRAKNMFLTTWDRVHWQPWLYDNDTCVGINNVGQLVFDYYHEDHDYVGDKYVYNGAESALWVNFREAFSDEIRELYAEWRKSDDNNVSSYSDVKSLLSYDKIIEYFITRQSDKWSISVYNEDAEFKYISMLRSDNDATNLPQIRGTGEEHLKYFVKNRLMYCDSKWNAGYYPEDRITLRLYSPEGDLAVIPNHDITVTSYSNIYAGVRYNANGILQQKRVDKNIPTTFNASADSEFGDTDTYIYGASEMSSIGNLASLYCGYVDVSKATKLTELIIGSDVDGYSNTNLKTITVGTNKLLKKINICNCPNVIDPLGLSNCPNIQEIYATGSSITGVELPSSGYLKKVYLPGTLTNLTVTNQQYIQEFELAGYDALTTLRIENTVNIPVEDIMLNAPNLNRIRLIDVSWTAESESALVQTIEKFKSCLGLDANGNNTNNAVVTGRVHVNEKVSDEIVGDIYNSFPNLIVDDGSEELYIVNYKDWDGTILYSDRLAEGADAIDPIELEYIETPSRESDENYSYEFIGWSILPTNVNRHYIVTAQYNTKVAINFAIDGEIIHSDYVVYGSNAEDPVANGTIEAPTKEGTDDLRYVFDGWDGSLLNITTPRTLNALFANVYPVHYYATESSTTPYYTQWIKQGSDAYDPIEAGECTTPPDIITSNEKKLIFRTWNPPGNVTNIMGVYAIYDTYWAARFWNDSVLYLIEWVLNGSNVIEPKDYFEDYVNPTRESTAQYDYTFSNWSGDFEVLSEARDYYAEYYSTIRKYNVYFYNDTELLQTVENVQYGSNAYYTGPTPTKLGVDNPEEYVFKGWLPAAESVTGETYCYALFKFTGYLFGKLAETEDADQGYGTVDNPNWDTINAYWSTIKYDVDAYSNGALSEDDFIAKYPIGGRMIIPINLSEGVVAADVEIIAHNHDDLADNSGKSPLTFFCLDLPQILHRMNETSTNEGGWKESEMRNFLNNELFNALPEEVKTIIASVYKISDGGTNNKILVTTTDKCWLASYDEVGLTSGSNNLSKQGSIYSAIFSSNKNSRKKYITNDTATGGWWLRTSYYSSNSNSMFWRVTNSGGSYSDIAFNSFYVAFGFCIK